MIDTDFTGKVVLVTGAAQGIGAAIAQAFKEAGAIPWLADIDQQGVEAAARTIDGATLFAKNSDRRGREPQPFVQFVNTWGQDKVLFGTDWPVIDPERAIAEIEELGLRPEPARKLLRDNALRLFRLPESNS